MQQVVEAVGDPGAGAAGAVLQFADGGVVVADLGAELGLGQSGAAAPLAQPQTEGLPEVVLDGRGRRPVAVHGAALPSAFRALRWERSAEEDGTGRGPPPYMMWSQPLPRSGLNLSTGWSQPLLSIGLYLMDHRSRPLRALRPARTPFLPSAPVLRRLLDARGQHLTELANPPFRASSPLTVP